ncbi:MAG: carbon monoxide dehydrogenase [Rhodospirillaceae bacterium]|nr:carbon monoxide dehydrogenase [Rhodospirillaceae bacterium]|tara:strand:- start:8376 stop:10682 length:2307 start_codon:yes stop_codon:yes gene_type:complete
MGQSVPRTEDPRLLTGGGQYVDDIRLLNECHAYMLRSPYAHARIVSIDFDAAGAMPGVIAIFTGADWLADGHGQHSFIIPRAQRNGEPQFCPTRHAIEPNVVKVTGDIVAMVIAESVDQGKDAAEQIEVEYEPLPVIVDGRDARVEGAVVLHEGCPTNESYYYEAGDKEAVEAAIASAHHVTKFTSKINRITANTMEPRCCIGDYDQRFGRYTLYSGAQLPHMIRKTLANDILGVPETAVSIVSPDVGGSFGMKQSHAPENHACLWAARKVGRPVRWIGERSEGHMTDYHDRDQYTEAELALAEDGEFLAVKVDNVCSIGAWLDPFGTISPVSHLGGLAATYKTPLIYAQSSAVFTNTSPNGPFRGSGRPEAAYVIERLIDMAAKEMDIDRAEIRRRNMVLSEDMPFKTGLIYTFDCGDFGGNMEITLDAADYDGFEARREAASKCGKLRGLGIANFIEQTAQMFGETVTIQFDQSGTVTLMAGSADQGQGHDTMYKILVSDLLGIDTDDIRVSTGNTDEMPFGGGSYASRTAILGGSATARAADKILEKGTLIAAHFLEAAEADIEFSNGAFQVVGTDRQVDIQEVARASYRSDLMPEGMERGLFATDTFEPGTPTFPNGCHVVEVEIDPETGVTEVVKYSVTDDVGTVINELTLDGQVHGGIGQGIGQAFSEQIVYDDDGQLVTGSFLDYGMPRADDMCSFDLSNNPVPTKLNPIGAKGAGEAGNVGALAAIMNAVVDALSPLGITTLDMPATPNKVWQAIHEARS